VPTHLRRFVLREWVDEVSPAPDWTEMAVRAHRLWSEARMEWARARGYDVDARYGAKPGRDWAAFLEACEDGLR
jgi:hypothetical protein